MKIKNTIIASIIAIGIISGGALLVINNNKKLDEKTPSQSETNNKKPSQEDNKKPDLDTELDNDSTEEENDNISEEKKPISNNPGSSKPTKPSDTSGNKPSVPTKPQEPSEPDKPEIPDIPEKPIDPDKPTEPDKPVDPDIPEKPTEPDKPVDPDKPTEPDKPVIPEYIATFKITNDMASNGTIILKNKKYGTLTVSSDIEKNVKITLENIEVTENLILDKPNSYQLNLVDTKILSMEVTANMPSLAYRLLKTQSLYQMNKALEGPTINFDNGSSVDDILISNNVEINGTSEAANINVVAGSEVVLNIPGKDVTLNTNGIVNINNSIKNLNNTGSNSSLIISSQVENFVNEASSNIKISETSNITNFETKGDETTISGNGTITNAKISGNNTIIYTEITNTPELDKDVENVLIRKENDIQLLDVHSTSQSSVTFTLNKPTKLTINDISVICNRGKSISLFNLTTKDEISYTLSTSYYKNDSYELYLTLPNGNIISKSFDTDYANPTVNKVVVDRKSNTDATLELYGVDEGGILYYIIEDATSKETLSASSIKENGKSERVKMGYNAINISDLEEGKMYNLYYVIEGYFNNLSKVKGPFEIDNQVTEPSDSEYKIIYAEEEIENRFVFKLNKAPKKTLTLEDFEIKCPQETNLTTSGAKFIESPDRLTYILVVPNNYGHKDNKYQIKIKISDEETIESSFVSHFDPPYILGAVDNVIRPDENTASLEFSSDEEGTIYYGVYEWNGAIYDYNSTTPFATDVFNGSIESRQQKLNSGINTITVNLSGITVTNNTRIWALFVDYDGNYRTGFVDHYKIPAYQNPVDPDPIESTLKITNFKVTNNKTISIDFNDVLGWVSSNDLEISIVQGGSLPSKILYSINNDTPKHLGIELLNHVLTKGEYKLTIRTVDKDEKDVTITKNFIIE